MCMICLPCRKEHGQTGHESGEGACLGRAEAHGRSLAETGQGTVERVDAMAEPE